MHRRHSFLCSVQKLLNGDNEQSFGTSGISDAGGSVSIDAVQGPNLYIGFIRSSFDIGDASILFGISNAMGTTRIDQGFSSSEITGEAVNANTDIIGGDLTVKYSLDAIRYLSFQSEYMYACNERNGLHARFIECRFLVKIRQTSFRFLYTTCRKNRSVMENRHEV